MEDQHKATYAILFSSASPPSHEVCDYICARLNETGFFERSVLRYEDGKPRLLCVRLSDESEKLARCKGSTWQADAGVGQSLRPGQELPEPKRITSAQMCRVLQRRLSEVKAGSQFHQFFPTFHGESMEELLRACQGVGIVESVFPLHEDAVRRSVWRMTNLWILDPPIEDVRDYFGERSAFYFAWVQFYTEMAFFPAVPGCLLWGGMTFAGVSIDNAWVVSLFGIAVCVWAHVFIRLWCRKCAAMAFRWGTLQHEKTELVRHEFVGDLRTSPITGLAERHYPYWRRLRAYAVSCAVTCAMLCLALCVMFALLNLQGIVKDPRSPFNVCVLSTLAAKGAIFDPDGMFALVPVLCYVTAVMLLNMGYRKVAEWLTCNENHRLESEHANSLIIKRVFFEMFDCYAALLYIAFYQLDVVRLRQEVLALYTADEIRRVLLETIVPFAVQWWRERARKKQLQLAIKAAHAPKPPKTRSKSRGEEKEGGGRGGDNVDSLTEWVPERDADLDEYEDFDDYLEMVIQFGYVVLFASACPLAAFLSIMSNIIEMRSDLFKLCFLTRRPRPDRAANIGMAWTMWLDWLSFASILTNCLIIGCSSEQMHCWFPSLFDYDSARRSMEVLCDPADAECMSRAHIDAVAMPVVPGKGDDLMSIIFGCEHLLIIVCLVIRAAIPSVPKDVHYAIRREKYLKRQEMDQEMRWEEEEIFGKEL